MKFIIFKEKEINMKYLTENSFFKLSKIWQILKLKRKSLKLTLKGKHRLDSHLEINT